MQMKNRKNVRLILLITFTISLSGLSPAQADNANIDEQSAPAVVAPAVVAPAVVAPAVVAPAVVAPAEASTASYLRNFSSNTAKPESVRDVLNWVCKTVITIVGIAVWLPTVVSTGGTTTVVLAMVIRYGSVPVIACAWL
jgi:hypothetical protein